MKYGRSKCYENAFVLSCGSDSCREVTIWGENVYNYFLERS